MTQEALKLALEALGSTWTDVGTKQYEIEEEAITAIKEVLQQSELDHAHELLEKDAGIHVSQQEQEPHALQGLSAYLRCEAGGVFVGSPSHDALLQWAREVDAAKAQRTWVGLTEDERDHLEGLHLYAVRGQVEAWIEGVDDFAQAIEAKLKEKNT